MPFHFSVVFLGFSSYWTCNYPSLFLFLRLNGTSNLPIVPLFFKYKFSCSFNFLKQHYILGGIIAYFQFGSFLGKQLLYCFPKQFLCNELPQLIQHRGFLLLL
jgi:hypothetical protein